MIAGALLTLGRLTVSAEQHAGLSSIQALIDAAEPYDTVRIPAGSYNESLVITKPLTLKGDGEVIITAVDKQPVMTIETDHVEVTGLVLIQPVTAADATAILAYGNNHRFHHLRIETQGTGIRAEGTQNFVIAHNEIVGEKSSDMSRRGHGVEIWFSHGTHVHSNVLRWVRDGVYVERSSAVKIKNNDIERSRYGIHLMFTQDTVVSHNRANHNIVGGMIMGTQRSKVTHNEFRWNYFHVNAKGLLLYDETETEVSHNFIEHNLVGLFIDDSQHNTIHSNQIASNVIGLQLDGANDNKIFNNTIMANVTAAQAQQSANNVVYANYWDVQGIDITGDGLSEVPFEADPFLQQMVDQHPAAQILVGSPGLPFLQQLFKTDTSGWLRDEQPLTQPTNLEFPARSAEPSVGEWNHKPWLYSIIFVLSGMLIIYLGGWRK
ncbi:right-handed parallel beta-helix repeat-containing protein [Caldalkalibacillus thermarum]|uniref:right-handed parallel beta-helix repeat-containing protein n=1 Tax=Caldalkalibacillus thermarum TaxID=296745 RepID=UPI00166A581A|nr:NosD domain-containing protein [Caldalkalibacillus thermarum]